MTSNDTNLVQPLQNCQAPAQNNGLDDHEALSANSELHPKPPRLAFSVKETAEMLGVSEKSVHRLIARGLLNPSRALRHLLIPKREIERFLAKTSIQ